jgi:hypothetical protein
MIAKKITKYYSAVYFKGSNSFQQYIKKNVVKSIPQV